MHNTRSHKSTRGKHLTSIDLSHLFSDIHTLYWEQWLRGNIPPCAVLDLPINSNIALGYTQHRDLEFPCMDNYLPHLRNPVDLNSG